VRLNLDLLVHQQRAAADTMAQVDAADSVAAVSAAVVLVVVPWLQEEAVVVVKFMSPTFVTSDPFSLCTRGEHLY